MHFLLPPFLLSCLWPAGTHAAPHFRRSEEGGNTQKVISIYREMMKSNVDLKYGMWPSEAKLIFDTASTKEVEVILESGTANGISTQIISRSLPEIPVYTFDQDAYNLHSSTEARLHKCCPNVKTHVVKDAIPEIQSILLDSPNTRFGIVIDGPKGQMALKEAVRFLKGNTNVAFVAVHDTAPSWKTFGDGDFDISGVTVVHSWTPEFRWKYGFVDATIAVKSKIVLEHYRKTGPGLTILTRSY